MDQVPGHGRTVITMGTFDLFHVGHLRLLERARALGDRLVVGVSSDALTVAKKQRAPVYDQEARRAIVAALRCVGATFIEESLEFKADYARRYGASLFVIGDDWQGRFDDELRGICDVVYLPRTPSVSSTHTIELIRCSPGAGDAGAVDAGTADAGDDQR